MAGYWFGNLPVVKNNLSFVILGIVGISVLPIVVGWLRQLSVNQWLAPFSRLALRCAMRAYCWSPSSACRLAPAMAHFAPGQLAKTDIDRVVEAHRRDVFASLKLLAEKLYRRNPREWKKGGHASQDGGARAAVRSADGLAAAGARGQARRGRDSGGLPRGLPG